MHPDPLKTQTMPSLRFASSADLCIRKIAYSIALGFAPPAIAKPRKINKQNIIKANERNENYNFHYEIRLI